MEPKATTNRMQRAAEAELRLPPALQKWAAAWRRSGRTAPADLLVVEASDLGLRLTRVVRRGKSAPRLTSAFRNVAIDLMPAARELAERRALAAMVAELGAAGRPAVAALSGPDIVVRRLSMPAMRQADLRSALELECRRHVNYPIAEAEIRFELLEPASKGRELSVLVVIAPRRRVEERRALVLSAGLRPWAITVAAAGLRADLERRGALAPNEVVAYLDIGTDASQIVVLKGRDIRFSRDLAFGQQTLAAALRQIVVPGVGTVERTPEAAEELLRTSGVPLGAEEANFVDGVPLAAVGIMLRPTLERLVRDLWNSFDYCNEQFLGEAVSRVVLLGPGARLRNLAGYLGGVLKMPVRAADDPSQRGAEMAGNGHEGLVEATASGVMLASISRDTLNFSAGGPGEGISWIAEAVPAPAVAAAAALLIVSIAAPAEIQNAQVRQRVATLRHGLEQLGSQSSAVAQFRAERAEEARLEALMARLTGSQVVWSTLLRDLSHRIGADVRLTAVEVLDPAAATPSGAAPVAPEPRSLRISGLLRTEGAPAERTLAALMNSLGSSPEFDQVRLEGCERVAPGLSGFTLTARLSEKAGT